MESTGLTLGGWIFLAASWYAIVTLTFFCFKSVLGTKKVKPGK
ncbi:MAG: hypothetical protein ALAOOOJD_00434 [bacterium]|nr:hypothetical protein [bacterium]